MLHFIGMACSCAVTGYVLFEIMEHLYEKNYCNNKLVYGTTYILYIVLSIGVAWAGMPLLNVVTSIVALYGMTRCLYKAHGKSILINTGFIIIYLVIVDIVVTSIFSTFLRSSTYDILADPKYFLVSGIGNAIIILCTYKLVIQILQHCQITVISKLLHVYMIFLMVFEFGILCYLVRLEIGEENNLPLILVCLGFVVLDAGVIYLYQMLSKEAVLEKKAELIEQQLEMTQKYYEGLQENYEQIQRILHDTKKHIQVLSELDDINKKEYAKELLTSIGSAHLQFQCSDKIICAIIWNNIQICEQKGIEFEINMQDIKFDFMGKIEITALFANLLDNAIEACESSSKERKKIILRIHKFKEYIVIKLRNTIGAMPKAKEGKLISTKDGHLGVGMVILEGLANKYCGNIDYEFSNEYFETKIILSVNNTTGTTY